MRIASFFNMKSIVAVGMSLAALVGGDQLLVGRVISVSDGDTLTIYVSGAGTQKVRLYGVDCPESGQPGGSDATNFTRRKALFKKADLTILDRDRYGRQVGVLKLDDGTVLNEALLSEGHAWLYEAYCKTPRCIRWKVLETQAKKKRAGIWRANNPQAPWKWRKSDRG